MPKIGYMRSWIKRKKWWLVSLVIIAGIVGGVIAATGGPNEDIVVEKVQQQDLRQTVLATGQVTSSTDLALSFKSGGVVRRVLVKVGQKVGEGEVLAQLDQRDQLASFTSARAAFAQAQANYQKLLDGASSPEIQSSQSAVDAAKVVLENAQIALRTTQVQQKVLVQNAYAALLNSTPEAVASPGNISQVTVSISGSYTGTAEGQYKVNVYGTGGGMRFVTEGLERAEGEVKNTPVPLGTKGLFIQFTNGTLYPSVDTWTIDIPNTKAATYTANYNAYLASAESQKSAEASAQATVRNAETALAQAEANLEVRKQQARPAELSAARAQILSATGQVQAAEASLENTIIRAPAGGTVTNIDIKVGEVAAPQAAVITLQDVESLHVEANISEANIAHITLSQSVEFTFDALGPDRVFSGKVQAIDPASTVVSGVVNYKVTALIDKVEEIRPGMTANMTVLVAERKNVITAPSRAIVTREGGKVARVITDSEKKIYTELPVTVGLLGDGGIVEILSGLQPGQEVVTLIKPK
jgi:RND family efflux transporter MFP subunit